jgi:hypothetical protein
MKGSRIGEDCSLIKDWGEMKGRQIFAVNGMSKISGKGRNFPGKSMRFWDSQ